MRSARRPLFVRDGAFAFLGFNAGGVAFVFVPMTVAGHARWFLGSCDLAVPGSIDMLRDAIMTRETGPDAHRLSRDEQLEIIGMRRPRSSAQTSPFQTRKRLYHDTGIVARF